MLAAYKPNGYNSVSPYLIINDAEATIDFLTRVFNATELRRHHRPDGRIAHAEAIQAPQKRDDPDRRCGVRDLDGNGWWIATMVE